MTLLGTIEIQYIIKGKERDLQMLSAVD